MKAVKKIGFTLIASILYTNLISCSDSNENEPEINIDNITTNEKQLVKITSTDDEGYSGEYLFSYDSKGRIASITEKEYYDGETDTDITNFIWEENTIEAINDYETTTFTLSGGLLYSGKSSDSDGCNYSFGYNSAKRLISVDHWHSNYNYDTSTMNITWDEGKIIRITEEDEYYTEITNITYSDKTCNGFFPFYSSLIEDDLTILWAQPELGGIRNNNLPSVITEMDGDYETVIEMTYTMDSDGYIASCTSKETESYNGKVEYIDTYVYKFTWK